MKNKGLFKTSQDKKQFKKWINALRSGEYKQAPYRLQSKVGYCCLGVACKVLIPQNKLRIGKAVNKDLILGSFPDHQKNAPEWLKNIAEDFENKTYHALTHLNDSRKFSFNEIADLLEIVYIHKADFETKES